MTRTNIIAIAASLTTLATLASAPARAETISFKPLQGASLKIGSEHAVGYFTNDKGRCNLVVTRAGEPNWDENGGLTVTRFESSIPAGKTASYDASVKFTCTADAQSMLIEPEVQVAASAAK
jgi:hypothetical protein